MALCDGDAGDMATEPQKEDPNANDMSLTDSMSRLDEALQQRDQSKKATAALLGSAPKARAKAKAQSKAKAQKPQPKAPEKTVKKTIGKQNKQKQSAQQKQKQKQGKKKTIGKQTQKQKQDKKKTIGKQKLAKQACEKKPRELKMTKKDVYSRAYHSTRSTLLCSLCFHFYLERLYTSL